MIRRRSWRYIAHRTGFLASPSLAFLGVPFGRKRRDLAGEVMRALSESHDAKTCPLCDGSDY